MNAYQRNWLKKNQHRLQKYRKNADLKKKYGIDLTEYNRLLVEQKGVCAICAEPETQCNPKSGLPYNLAVDHCHATNKVRQLLCSNCNRTLGMVNDNVDLLLKMISYVEKHSKV